MSDERQEFTFSTGSLGDLSTQDLIDAGENFLDSDPDTIAPIKKEERKQEEKEEKESKKEKKEEKKVKEVIIPDNRVEEEDMYSLMEKKSDEEEDEEVDPKKPTNQKVPDGNTPGENGEEEPEESVFNTIAKELIGLGVFSEEEDEEGNPVEPSITTPEEFAERFQVESRRQAADVIDKFLERFGDDYKDMFESVFVKGIPPRDYLDRYTKIQSMENADLTDEANQERVVRELMRSEGRSSEFIDAKITKMKNYGDLQDEATEAKRILIEREKVANDKAAADKQAEIVRRQQDKSNYVGSINRIIQEKLKVKEFDGIPLSREFADQTLGYITQERYQTPDKQLLTEFDKDILDLSRPENHPLKVKVAMLIQLAKEDPQLTKLAKKAVSKESNTLFQGIKRTANKSTSTSKKAEQDGEPKSWF